MNPTISPTPEDRILAGFMGGALGDALGEPVEFLSAENRLNRWGHQGIMEFVYLGQRGHFTDDTQLTLFTAEALILHASTGEPLQIALHKAYMRWLLTQEVPCRLPTDDFSSEGFLLDELVLHQRMGPGRTCLTALAQAVDWGIPAINNSKGCGGLMRVAPIGFWAAIHPEHWPLQRTFQVASSAAQLTHGHLCGYLSAGAFAVLLQEIISDTPLNEALAVVMDMLSGLEETGQSVLSALQQANDLAEKGVSWPAASMLLGKGWVAEEILAISVYLGLTAPDFLTGIRWAANYPGDADSIGAISGQLLGAIWGIQAIPEDWIERLDGKGVIYLLVSQFLNGTQW